MQHTSRVLVGAIGLGLAAAGPPLSSRSRAAHRLAATGPPRRGRRDHGGASVRPNARRGRPSWTTSARSRAILDENCLECHSQDKRKGGLSLATYEDVLEGGRERRGGAARQQRAQPDSRPASRAPSSRRCRKTNRRSTRRTSTLIRRWIDQGARAAPASRAGAAALGGAAGADARRQPPRRSGRPGRRRSIASPRPTSRTRKSRSRRSSRMRMFARRAYLDVWGLLPSPEALQAFVADTAPGKRDASGARRCWPTTTEVRGSLDLVLERPAAQRGRRQLLLRDGRPQEHHAVAAGRAGAEPAVRRVRQRGCSIRVDPADPEGFVIGVNWRGETSAAVKPWMQASQNTAQIFLGVNLKCNSCHDSFVSKWKLKDAYALAAYFAPEPTLQLYRCDVAQDKYAEPGFLFPELSRVPSSDVVDRSPRRRRGDLHRPAPRPAAAHPRQPALDPPPRPRHRRRTLTRWTASRGARSCSTGWPATSSRTSTT